MAKKRSRKGGGRKRPAAAKKPSARGSTGPSRKGSSGASRTKSDVSSGRRSPPSPNESPTRRRVFLGITALTSVVLVFLLAVPKPAGTVSQAAENAARAAGCRPLETPAAQAPGGIHLSPGASYDYPDKPAASGPHDPSPLPFEPQVYDAPIPETRAVHNLEHAFVIVYYRQDDPGSLPLDVVDRLKSLVESRDRTLMAPYPDLPSGTGLALMAWNKRWECPSTISPDQAATVAGGFMDAYVGTGNAPEAPGRLHL